MITTLFVEVVLFPIVIALLVIPVPILIAPPVVAPILNVSVAIATSTVLSVILIPRPATALLLANKIPAEPELITTLFVEVVLFPILIALLVDPVPILIAPTPVRVPVPIFKIPVVCAVQISNNPAAGAVAFPIAGPVCSTFATCTESTVVFPTLMVRTVPVVIGATQIPTFVATPVFDDEPICILPVCVV